MEKVSFGQHQGQNHTSVEKRYTQKGKITVSYAT
jgi:hypothetical protein